jgi:hypothetical protein
MDFCGLCNETVINTLWLGDWRETCNATGTPDEDASVGVSLRMLLLLYHIGSHYIFLSFSQTRE